MKRFTKGSRRGALALVALPLALAACAGGSGTQGNRVAGSAPCPRIALLADGADLTRFRQGAGRDLTQMVVDARINGFDARCDWANRDRNALEVQITPRFVAERGPATENRTVELPWFVAVSDAQDNVLQRVNASTRLTFALNATRGNTEANDILRGTSGTNSVKITLPVSEARPAEDYRLHVSFQLSPEELAHNRQRGPR